MKNFPSSSPKFLAILIGLMLTIIALFILSLYLFNIVDSINLYVFLTFSALFIFTATFIPVYFILNHFILKRIEPIYKAIDAIKIPQKDLYDNIEDKDIILELRSEVMLWAKLKAKEIEQLKYNEQLRKEFIGNIAHELKTPVFNIQGYVLTLLDGALEDEELTKRYLKRTAKNIKRMISIIKDVDTIARLEDGQMHLEYSAFNLCNLIHEVIELQEIKQEKYNINIEFNDSECQDIKVKADKDKISDVINNLVVNSIKYGKTGGTTKIELERDLNKVFIIITDNGIGIGEEHLPHIFERFYRVDKSRSRERGGSGLGLAIVKHVIEAHHQQIWVTSNEGEGTSFKFSLQLAKLNAINLEND